MIWSQPINSDGTLYNTHKSKLKSTFARKQILRYDIMHTTKSRGRRIWQSSSMTRALNIAVDYCRIVVSNWIIFAFGWHACEYLISFGCSLLWCTRFGHVGFHSMSRVDDTNRIFDICGIDSGWIGICVYPISGWFVWFVGVYTTTTITTNSNMSELLVIII